MSKIPSLFTKIAITRPRMVQIPKFWCLKSSTNIWPSFRNIYSVPKVIKIYSDGRKGSKPAKMGQFFTSIFTKICLHCKKLKLHLLKIFPRFDLTAFFCDFVHMRPFRFNWQSSWYRTGVLGGMHGWRDICVIEEKGFPFYGFAGVFVKPCPQNLIPKTPRPNPNPA